MKKKEGKPLIKIGLLGASGRMGQVLIHLIHTEASQKARLFSTPLRGEPLHPLLQADVVIDFSSAKGVRELTDIALATVKKTKKAKDPLPVFVIGSTGWKPNDKRKLKALSAFTPIVMASNFSTGILALLEILKQAAPLLEKLKYSPVVLETHHHHKKDTPSGTALTLHRVLTQFFSERVSIQSVRIGEVIGNHEISFKGPADRMTLGHFAQDRSVFARGALEVALWLVKKKKKLRSLSGMIPLETYFKECIQ